MAFLQHYPQPSLSKCKIACISNDCWVTIGRSLTLSDPCLSDLCHSLYISNMFWFAICCMLYQTKAQWRLSDVQLARTVNRHCFKENRDQLVINSLTRALTQKIMETRYTACCTMLRRNAVGCLGIPARQSSPLDSLTWLLLLVARSRDHVVVVDNEIPESLAKLLY